MSFKGVLKHTIYIFIGAWMFLLGIMVGRGTAPVTFETRGFQERLQSIVKEFGKPGNTIGQEDKIVLDYYEALNDPINPEEMIIVIPIKDLEKKLPDAEEPPAAVSAGVNPDAAIDEGEQTDSIPVKTSTKAATFKKRFAAEAEEDVTQPREPEAARPLAAAQKSGPGAAYTIQVAAFKSFKDAVTQMAILDEKGFASDRTSKEIDGTTWYRVRVGEFATREEAGGHLVKLNQAGINGMIIKKE
jgi:cell division septation protein DedD